MEEKHIRKARRIAKLIAGYMRDELDQDEHDELDEWVGACDANQKLFEEMTDKDRVIEALKIMNNPDVDFSMYTSYRKVLIRIFFRTNRWRSLLWCIGIATGIYIADTKHVAVPFIIGIAFGIIWTAALYKKSFSNRVL